MISVGDVAAKLPDGTIVKYQPESLSPPVAVTPGQKVSLTIHNNGAYGITRILVGIDQIKGKIEGTGVVPTEGFSQIEADQEIRHYLPLDFQPETGGEGDISDATSYTPDQKITFTAPPNAEIGQESVYRFLVDDRFIEITFRVSAVTPDYNVRLLSSVSTASLSSFEYSSSLNSSGHVAHVAEIEDSKRVLLDVGQEPELEIDRGPINTNFSALKLNDQDHVAYSREDRNGPTEAILWTGGNQPRQVLGNLGGRVGVIQVTYSQPIGLTNSDVVWGHSLIPGEGFTPYFDSLFRWQNGVLEQTPGSKERAISFLGGVNEQEELALVLDNLQNQTNAVFISGGQSTVLSTTRQPLGAAINQQHQVLYTKYENGVFRPQLWTRETGAQPLEQLPEWFQSIGRGLNDSGTAVGQASVINQVDGIGVLWQGGHAIDLNSVVPDGSPKIIDAIAIGNGDHILVVVQEGTQQRLALLTPKP